MSAASESAFRNALSSRGGGGGSQPTVSTAKPSVLSRLSSLNPFSQEGYIRLPVTENNGSQPPPQLPQPDRASEEAGWFVLSRWDRLLVFAACILGAAVCFVVAFFLMPVLVLKPRKFVVLWTVGSALFLVSFAVLMGPMAYLQHLISAPRLPFTAAYFGSMGLTLYFAIGLHSMIGTLIMGIVQIIALLYYLVSYFPFGGTTLKFGSRFMVRRVENYFS